MRGFVAIAVGLGLLLGGTPGAVVAQTRGIDRVAGVSPPGATAGTGGVAPESGTDRTAGVAPAVGAAGAQMRALRRILARGIRAAGSSSGAFVVDLDTARALFSARADTPRLPASVEKVYTTSTALLRLSPETSLATIVLGRGTLDAHGGWHGILYLKGGGDPSFGSASFDRSTYGSGVGATTARLAANLIRQSGITSVHGAIVGDESYFDSLRGTAATGFGMSSDLEGELSALAYDRGQTDESGTSFQSRPALFAAESFVGALRSAGVKVPARTSIFTGRAPASARTLATVQSPRLATLVALTNAPSDNFFAEMLLKVIGARIGTDGSSAAGASVVRAELASRFGIHPRLDDGSGLSRADRTTPRQVVTILTAMADNQAFVRSLAIAGETGTLRYELQGTFAQGRCRGKTGTLHDVSNLVGYCRARDGHTLAFAFLMNSIDPTYAHQIQDAMALALTSYNG
ncbi:MAG: D-alanyl-D-alanine carboxypeptidase/D-alanyl-D-alanine endopeptidase [Solirubrobacteraceae bacterium]